MKKLALALTILTLVAGFAGNAAAQTGGGLELPLIAVEPGSYDFGLVPLGAGAIGYLVVSNPSHDATLTVSAVKTKAPFSDGATSFTIPPLGSRRVMIYFLPLAPGSYESVCTFQSNAANAPVLNVPLSGICVE